MGKDVIWKVIIYFKIKYDICVWWYRLIFVDIYKICKFIYLYRDGYE